MSKQYEAIDCQSFAGGFTLGMVQSGFKVTQKYEATGGFGVPLINANRRLFGEFETQIGDPKLWEPRQAQVVFGNPPCSGFSNMSAVSNRTGWGIGAEHAINQCMWDMVRLAGSCDPEIVIMESVQQAFSKGRSLMQDLRQEMEGETGELYDLIHVKHNSASVGGHSIRPRYFMVLAKPYLHFGIEPPVFNEPLCTFGQLIHDLPAKKSRTAQKYRRKAAHPYVEKWLRSKTGVVAGHVGLENRQSRGVEWIAENAEWLPSEHVGHAVERLPRQLPWPEWLAVNGERPRWPFATHAYSPRRWAGDKLAGVATGTAVEDIVHPTEPRVLTLRETARIMGFPDDLDLEPIFTSPGGKSSNQKWLGKGITVAVGRWIGHWAINALDDNPGQWRGELIGEGEWLIDVTNDYKVIYDPRTGHMVDSRSDKLKKEMAERMQGVLEV